MYSPSGSYEYSQTTYQLFNGNTVTLNGSNISCTDSAPSPSLPCATIDENGVVTQLAYNAQGDLTSSSAPDGNPGNEQANTTFSYDANGEQTAQVAPDGNLPGANAGNYTTTTARNADGQKTSVTQGNGAGYTDTPRGVSYGYDADGNQTTVKDARSHTTTTTYNADDQATLVTDSDGNAALTCYDPAGNVVETVPPAGVAATNLTPASCPASFPADYNPANKPPLASDATLYAYDADGNQTAEYTPAPAGQTGYETTTDSYDGNGNALTTTEPATSNGGPNQVTVDTYNTAGQLATETTGYGTTSASTVSYCYDGNGDTTSVVYPDGNANSGVAPCNTNPAYPDIVDPTAYPYQAGFQTTYSYDSAGDQVSATTPPTAAAPNGATTTCTYDPAGNMLTSTDPNGVTTTWTYTPGGQPATVSYSGSSAHSVSYSYDADGGRTAMTDATGSSSY
ncbi:MAG: RHS repeat domain-containing protein, partial [Streptosporangiaceae bacterium]